MALNIKDPETDRLARELAAVTGMSITEAVGTALRERLERVEGAVPTEARKVALTELALKLGALPDRDPRTAEDIIGYDDLGLPE